MVVNAREALQVARVSDDVQPFQLPPYGSLLAGKKVVPSTRTNYVAVDVFLFFELMGRQLASVPFDKHWYLDKYPDVRDAITTGSVVSAHQHYIRFGYYEHRMPRQILVDEGWYVREYPDVKGAIKEEIYETGQQHFEIAGFREGRLPYAEFSLFRDDRPV